MTAGEVSISFTLTTPINLPADHYFFVPQVKLSSGDFFWLSAPKPIIPPGTPFPAGFSDLQTGIRNANLDPESGPTSSALRLPAILLAPGRYFFAPRVLLSAGNFYRLSAPRLIGSAPGTAFLGRRHRSMGPGSEADLGAVAARKC